MAIIQEDQQFLGEIAPDFKDSEKNEKFTGFSKESLKASNRPQRNSNAGFPEKCEVRKCSEYLYISIFTSPRTLQRLKNFLTISFELSD